MMNSNPDVSSSKTQQSECFQSLVQLHYQIQLFKQVQEMKVPAVVIPHVLDHAMERVLELVLVDVMAHAKEIAC